MLLTPSLEIFVWSDGICSQPSPLQTEQAQPPQSLLIRRCSRPLLIFAQHSLKNGTCKVSLFMFPSLPGWFHGHIPIFSFWRGCWAFRHSPALPYSQGMGTEGSRLCLWQFLGLPSQCWGCGSHGGSLRWCAEVLGVVLALSPGSTRIQS